MERQPQQDNTAWSSIKAFLQPFFPYLSRSEVRESFLNFIISLLSDQRRKNGWTLAEEMGLNGPQQFQRLLRTARGDWDAIRSKQQYKAQELLEDEQGVFVVDETGFIKAGNQSVGVQRQYTGTAGKCENSQVGVFVSYISSRGRALISTRLYLPQSWTLDPERCRRAGVPKKTTFATKPEIAADLLDELRDQGWQAPWVTGDEVYGDNPTFRERQINVGQKFVLAVSCTQRVWVRRPVMVSYRLRSGRIKYKPSPSGPRLRTVQETVSAFRSSRWHRLNMGEGSKGPRVYDWIAKRVIHCEANEQPGQSFWLLARRSVSKPNEISYYLCQAPVKTKLIELARVASARWSIEESIRDGKQEVGLDDYQVRKWDAWHRHMQLCLISLLLLLHLRQKLNSEDSQTVPLELVDLNHLNLIRKFSSGAWSIGEIRRVFMIALELPILNALFRLTWALFRHQHNIKAQRSHHEAWFRRHAGPL